MRLNHNTQCAVLIVVFLSFCVLILHLMWTISLTKELSLQNTTLTSSISQIHTHILKSENYNSQLNSYLDFITQNPIITVSAMPILDHSSTKAYMDYKFITSKSSAQYKLIYESGLIEVCEDGFLRDSDGYIGVAMTAYFGDIGNRYICEMTDGDFIKVVKVESKAPVDTSVNGFEHKNDGGVIEFVIDTNKMSQYAETDAILRSGNFDDYHLFNGEFVNIYYIDNIFSEVV